MVTLLTLFVLISAFAAPPLFAAPPDPAAPPTIHFSRVRSADARSASLLTQGLDRSATVRALVQQLEQRDVIVYVETQPSLRKRLAGKLTWLTRTKNHRYVRVSINPELNTDMAIATLGHELQHALEVANASEIVSERALEQFYQIHGDSSRVDVNGWDTQAARVAGDEVRRELAANARLAREAKSRAARVTDSIQQFDPNDWMVLYRRAQGMLPP
jgi:hypothetical protein